MTQALIHDLFIILAAGLLAGLICRWLSLSVLIGYLVVGVLLGQGALGWVLDVDHQIEHFAEAGVFLLLFSIGLEFSLDDLRRLGKNLFVGGAVQMSLVALPIAFLLRWMNLSWQSSVLIAAAVAFSSTVLVFKALSEYGHSSQPHGRRAIGILLFQDAALIPLLLMVPLLTGSGPATGAWDYLRLILISIFFVIAIVLLRYALACWLIPTFARYRSPELVSLFTIVSLGGVTLAAHRLGLPAAVGAFAAGLIFNGNRWSKQIDSLVLPFRETFAAIFFVSLGLIFDPDVLLEQPLLVASGLASVIVIKAIAGTLALRLTGLPIRSSIGMGIGLAHVGEFAFVLVLLGLEAGVISEPDYQRVVSIAVGSLILTPTLMKAGLRLIYDDGSTQNDEAFVNAELIDSNMATVIGAGPTGRQLASQLEMMGKDVCLIDLSPINLHPFALEGFRTVAGDANRSDILAFSGADRSNIVAVCVPDDDSAARIVRSIRKCNKKTILIVRCRFQTNQKKLTSAGADHIVSEETEASLALLRILQKFGTTDS